MAVSTLCMAMEPRAVAPARRLQQRRGGQHGAASGMLRLLCGVGFLPATILAFDNEGHDAQGQTTASAMDQQAIKGMKRLLGGQDASDVAGWGHTVDDTYPEVAKLHFQSRKEPFCQDLEKLDTTCEDNICLVPAIKHFYGRILKDEGRDPGASKVDIDLNKVASGMQFTDADAVKMLINLLGDLHQPMHIGFAGDDMGRKIKVKFRGNEMTLYELWDKHIGEIVRTDEASFWLGGWTHVGRVRAEHDADKEGWKKDGAVAMFDKWALESAKFACDVAYKLPGSGKMLAGPDATEGEVIEIDEAAYQEWRAAWLRQILLAGERTAIVLNDILDDKGAKKLSEGTKIKTKADEEAEKEKKKDDEERKERKAKEPKQRAAVSVSSQPPWSMANFMTNVMIAVVVVPAFLTLAAYGMNPFDLRAFLEYIESTKVSNNDSDGSASAGTGPKYAPGAGKRAN